MRLSSTNNKLIQLSSKIIHFAPLFTQDYFQGLSFKVLKGFNFQIYLQYFPEFLNVSLKSYLIHNGVP